MLPPLLVRQAAEGWFFVWLGYGSALQLQRLLEV
jgi:hypothetical protein